MKKIIILFTALIISILSSGQKIIFDACNFEKVYTRCETKPSFGKDNADLQHYFENALGDDLKKVSGDMVIKLIVDSTGKLCCRSVINNSNYVIDKPKFAEILHSQEWNPGSQNGVKVNCAELVILNFKKGKLTVEYKMDENPT